MVNEIDIYKNRKIANAQSIFNANVMRLKNELINNIKNIQKSRQSVRLKQNRINNIVKNYNNNINSLKFTLNKTIEAIQNYMPPIIKITGNKKALLIGINYTGTQNELFGCINDALSVKERIIQKGFNDIKMLTDATSTRATKTNILNEFKNLLINSQTGDFLFLLYSGHGSYNLDKNNDETTGYDQCIVPCDFNIIVDDELKTIIQQNLKPNVTLFAMFDSCYSGSVLDLRYQYMDSLNYDNFTENDKQIETPGNVFMISGCSDYQTSADALINNKANGAMTWALLEALNQAPNTSWRELVKNMRNLLKTKQFSQIPQFSTGNMENINSEVFI